jgi:hypothetical protein
MMINKHKAGILLTLAVILLLLASVSGAQAQSGASTTLSTGYDLTWNTVDGGGMTVLAAGAYTLSGTAGQPDAAVWSDGAYTLVGGFWAGAAVEYRVYLPLVLR